MKKIKQSYCHIEHVELRRLLSTIYVSSAAIGNNSGTSWTNAYTNLQTAITAAGAAATSSNPVVIEVGQGTYKPTLPSGRAATFNLVDNVSIQGGYAGTGQSNPDARNTTTFPTILSGDIGTIGNNSDNSYNVVSADGTVDPTAVLDGFTITKGNADGTNPQSNGGGIYDSGGSPTISNCIINGNTASFGGGGVYNINSSMTLSNCTISGNTAGTSGGGLYDRFSTLSLTDCTITDNSSDSNGGGILNDGEISDTLVGCTFSDNTATFNGGGIDNISSSQTLTGCRFTGNSASTGGGMSNSSSSPTLISCTFSGNNATNNGGAMNNNSSSPALTNCTLSGNTASNLGGGIYDSSASDVLTDCLLTGNSASSGGGLYDNSSPTQLTNCVISGNSATDSAGGVGLNSSNSILLNCTFSGNSAANIGGGLSNNSSSPSVTNCILWNDSASGYSEIANNSSTPTITFSDIGQSGITGTDDIDVDPLFLRNAGTNGPTDFGDLHLRPGSPAIDVGSNTAISGTTTDADGKPRIVNNTVDLGAYEYQIIFVDAHATGSNNGTNWADAFTNLQTALADATSGTPIHVAQGTYYPTSVSSVAATFQLKDGVTIYGGFAGDTTSTPSERDPKLFPTILSGDIGTPHVSSDNSNNVVTGSGTDSTAVLDGFTITDGNAKGGSGKQYGGGGIYDNDGSPTINDCIITGNQSSVDSGGGVYNIGGSSPIITNTTISNNSAFSVGGGIDNRNGSPTLINCSITGNTARAAGAGVYDYAAATFIDCLIAGNTTTGISGNPATGNGGGIYTGNTGVLTLINCTVAQNSAPHVGGIYNQSSGAPLITNSILWGDSPNEIVSSHAPNITYSDIDQSGFAGSNHNIDADPLFVNAAGGNFRLKPTSQGMDAGLNSAIAGTDTDLDGIPRIFNGTVDMGAYEFLSTIFVDANATGTNTGGSWANAFTTLTAALSLAFPDSGQTIDVAQGTYKPTTGTDRTATFQLLDDVSLFGGFAGNTTSNPAQRDAALFPTILSGEIGDPGISDNSYHVVNASDASASTVLDGFTITAGNADAPHTNYRGGGIYNHGGDLTINDCTITGNSASFDGGGMYNDASTLVLTDCIITGNTANNDSGGGIASQSTRLTIINSIIADNSANRGGGIFDSDVDLTLTNCTISGNASATTGGGLYGGVASETVTNCIFWGDTAQTSGNEIYIGPSDTATVTFSDVDQAGFAGSNGNIDTDPMFIDVGQHNYRIKVVSPAANVGLNSAIAGTDTDLDGNPRIINGTVDMGAYETWPIIYVDASATGSDDGSSFANAFTNLTEALTHATAGSGQSIDVAQGTYKPTTGTDRTATFNLLSGVNIEGGFAGDTNPNPVQRDVALFPTILSGDIGQAGLNTDNAYAVVTVNDVNSAELAGFTISGGYGSSPGPGGGIVITSSDFTLHDCILSGNDSLSVGGGMYLNNDTIRVTNCTIENNYALSEGGGAFISYCSANLAECTFSNNNSSGGGAIFAINCSDLELTDCIISENSARYGGGVEFDETPGVLTNSVLVENSANSRGGAIYDGLSNLTLTNCTITGNTSDSGGAIYNYYSNPSITNSIVWGNIAPTGNEISNDNFSSATVTYSDIDQSGYASSNHNVDADPMFIRNVGTNGASDFGDLHILDTSPAVNTGSNAAISGTTTDLDGNTRVISGTVDMGAYEARLIHLAFDISPNGNITAGGSLPVEVDIEDGNGNDVTTDDNSSVTLQINGGPAGATLHGTGMLTVQNGEAIFSGVSITQAGTYTISASDGSLPGATTGSFTITPGAAAALSISQQPVSTNAGEDIPLTVQVKDSFGNLVDGTSVNVALAPGSSSGTLNGTTPLATAGGTANFSNLTINQIGTYSFTITDGSLPAVTSSNFAINSASAAKLAFIIPPTDTVAGQTMAGFAVEVEDQFGNIAINDTSTVSLTSTPAGITASVAANHGIAEFTNVSSTTAGSYTLSATDSSLTGATSATFNITPATVTLTPPAQLVISLQPASATAGQNIPVTIEVKDQFGNLVDGSSVTIAIATGPSGATLGGTLTLPTTGGIATFNNITLDRAGAFTLSVRDGNLPALTSQSFTITYAGPQLVFITEPTNIVAGAKIPAFRVSPEDINGNPLLTNKSKITIRSSAGKLLGTSTASVKNGVAIFKNLSFQQAGSYTFQVTDTGFGSALSSTITVNAGAAAKMAFTPQPSSVVHGTPFNVTVDLFDRYGNLATNNSSTVELTLGSKPKTATFANLMAGVSDGAADFDDAVLTVPGTYTLSAIDGKLKAKSGKFVVS